jgi:hypothetical protein
MEKSASKAIKNWSQPAQFIYRLQKIFNEYPFG